MGEGLGESAGELAGVRGGQTGQPQPHNSSQKTSSEDPPPTPTGRILTPHQTPPGYGLWVKNLEVLFIPRVTQASVYMNHSRDFDNLIF